MDGHANRCSSRLVVRVAECRARVGNIFLITLPTRFGSVRRKDEAEGALIAIVAICLASREERTRVAHADVNRQSMVQEIF
jgi:hypothetical protein